MPQIFKIRALLAPVFRSTIHQSRAASSAGSKPTIRYIPSRGPSLTISQLTAAFWQLEAMWYKRSELKQQGLQKVIDERNKENQTLLGELSNERMLHMKLQANFDVRAALEYIVDRAKRDGLIKPEGPGVQKGLDMLAKLPEFKTVLCEVLKARKLKEEYVMMNYKNLYHEVSKYAHGHYGTVFIQNARFVAHECAGLIAIFKFQDQWNSPLDWDEIKCKSKAQAEALGYGVFDSDGKGPSK